MINSFKAFNLSKKMISSLNRQNYIIPSKVQALTIPKALKGHNLVVNSVTGSGKTHCYLIPIFNKLDTLDRLNLHAIVIAPTNELARQIYTFARSFKKEFEDISIRLFTSETSEKDNILSLKKPHNLIIATPGRLASLIKKGHLNVSTTKIVILDEADMLLELSYFKEIDEIMQNIHKPQMMIFSATIASNLENEIHKYIGTDFEITSKNTKTSANVSHHLIDIHHQDVNDAVNDFIKIKNPYFLLIFASNKNDVNSIYAYLKSQKYKVIMITGDLSERERKSALRRINNDEFQFVVASDLLSRGMDFNNVSEVLSVDLPSDLSYYYHRAGRTGRFNKFGHSYVFYNTDNIKRVNTLINNGIKFDYLSLKNGQLTEGKPIIKTFKNKKKLDDELYKDILKAKYSVTTKKVKPNYKKKVKNAVDKVKRKYRRDMIKKDIRRQREERYRLEAKNKNE